MGYAEQGFHVEDLFDLVFPEDMGVCGHLAMIFYGYLDDSKDRLQEKVIVSGSFIGTKDTWADFRIAWNKKLKEHDIGYYKTSEWRGLRGQFGRFSSEKNYPKPSGRKAADDIRDQLEKIVDSSGIGGIGIVISVPVFKEVLSMPEFKEKMERMTPYQLVLQMLFLKSVEQIKTVPGNHMVAFVHDEGDDCPFLTATYKEFKKKNPRTARYMAGFSCLDDKLHPPLQCADMVANTVNHYAQEWQVNPTEASLKRLRESILQVNVWSKDFLIKVLKSQTW